MPAAAVTIRDPRSGIPVNSMLEASAVPTGRKGYKANFLGIEVPLPEMTDDMKAELAEVQEGIGPNGNMVLDYTHYSLQFNKVKKLPVYTAVNIDGKTNLMGLPHEERSGDRWDQDDRILVDDEHFQFGNNDYKGTIFQKGHMVRYFDPAWGSSDNVKKTAMLDTFYYTNCCPQVGKYNAVVWNYLEDYYMARAIFQDKKITVFTGPIFNKAKKIGALLVPMNFWKVVVFKKDGELRAMGFIMSHERYLKKMEEAAIQEAVELEAVVIRQPKLKKEDIDRLYEKKEIVDAKVKISLIEEKTGLSFGLNEADENHGRERLFFETIPAIRPTDEAFHFPQPESAESTAEMIELLEGI